MVLGSELQGADQIAALCNACESAFVDFSLSKKGVREISSPFLFPDLKIK
jgi:hypothetical protein